MKLGRERQYVVFPLLSVERGEWQDVWVAGTVGTQLAAADVTGTRGKTAVVIVLLGNGGQS